jgi:hypothetical protein
MVSHEVKLFYKLFFAQLLIALSLYGLGFGLSTLPTEFATTIIIVFGSMLVLGVALYTKIIVGEIHKKQSDQKSPTK